MTIGYRNDTTSSGFIAKKIMKNKSLKRDFLGAFLQEKQKVNKSLSGIIEKNMIVTKCLYLLFRGICNRSKERLETSHFVFEISFRTYEIILAMSLRPSVWLERLTLYFVMRNISVYLNLNSAHSFLYLRHKSLKLTKYYNCKNIHR